MTTTPCFSQLYQSQTNLDSWVYINNFGEVRYDLPKYRIQRLDKLSRQSEGFNKSYKESQIIISQIGSSNLFLQKELLSLQKSILELEYNNKELITVHHRLVDLYNNSLDNNDTLEEELDECEKEVKKLKGQRNWTVTGLITLVLTIFLTSI